MIIFIGKLNKRDTNNWDIVPLYEGHVNTMMFAFYSAEYLNT